MIGNSIFKLVALASSSAHAALIDQVTCTTSLADNSTFQLINLRSEEEQGYQATLPNGNPFTWNYCKPFALDVINEPEEVQPETEGDDIKDTTASKKFYYYAVETQSDDTSIYYATEAIKADGKDYEAILATNEEDGTETVNGIKITQKGDTKCDPSAEDSELISFTTELTCDSEITSMEI